MPLAAAEQVVGIEPEIQGHFGAFKDGPHRHAKRTLASPAPIDSGTSRFTFQ
jgi:hypothetical protein